MDKQGLLDHLKKEGYSEEIITAFSQVKREDFLPEQYHRFAYEDAALPILYGKTISQPSTIAFMLELLEPVDGGKILEIGCGSGYVLSLLNCLCPSSEIYGTEIVKDLVKISKKRLKKHKNVKIFYTPKKVGLIEKRPFDRILVSASAHDTPYYLMEQLNDGGVAVCPVRKSIMKFKRKNSKLETEEHFGFSFLPLIE